MDALDKRRRKRMSALVVVLALLGIACAGYGVAVFMVNSGTPFFAVWFVLAALFLLGAWAVFAGWWAGAPVMLRRIIEVAIGVIIVWLVVTQGLAISAFGANGDDGTGEDLGYTIYIATVELDGETYTDSIKEIKTFLISFVDYDGTPLQSSTVNYGETPVFEGEVPSREDDERYSYTFAGWDPEIVPVTEEAIYTAKYDAEGLKFTIIWQNFDGAELYRLENVLYGATVEYGGETPVRPADKNYTYLFAGWYPYADEFVTGDATYTAEFYATLKSGEPEVDEELRFDARSLTLYNEKPRASTFHPNRMITACSYMSSRTSARSIWRQAFTR